MIKISWTMKQISINLKGSIYTGYFCLQLKTELDISCGEPVGGTPPVAKVMRKEARHMQRWDQASGVPLEILDHLPP